MPLNKDIERITVRGSGVQAPTSPVAELVEMPSRLRRYLPNETLIPDRDLAFLDGLMQKYGPSERQVGPRTEPTRVGEEQFHAAVGDLNTYILDLRRELDVGFREEPVELTQDEDTLRREFGRPSRKRVQTLCSLFLNIPPFKKTYMEIHREKMIRAFPKVRRAASKFMPNPKSLDAYFQDAMFMMGNNMILSLDPGKYEQYRNLGVIMGLRARGVKMQDSHAMRFFAVHGTGTFALELGRVVKEAVQEGVDVDEKVRSEFLDKGKSIHGLMRVQIEELTDMNLEPEGKSSAEINAMLREGDFRPGACPAVWQVDPDGEYQERRPIAYEYARILTRQIPKRLLDPASR